MDIVIYILIGIVSIVVGIIIDRTLLKKSLNRAVEDNRSKVKDILEDAEGKAKGIIKEAESEKKDKLLEAKEEMLKMKGNFEEEMNRKKNQLRNNENKLKQREQRLNKLQEDNKKREREIESIKDSLMSQSEVIQKRKDEAEKLRNSQVKQLEKIANLSGEEAKNQLLETLKDEVKSQASSLAKDLLEEAKLSATKAAKKVVIETIQRTATEHAIENCVSIFHIESDDIKGKIIGREGRNIRALEAATGVEVIVDDTPEAIIISGFDPVRREVAKIALHRLVTDGRIHPARIEEIVAKTSHSLEEQIVELGERTVIDLGIHGLHPELIKMVGRMRFRSSYGQNLLQHSREVANLCATMASELGLNAKLAKRAGLLHDIGKVYPDQAESPHAILGMELAKKYKEHPDVCNAVGAHHDEIEMKCLIAPIVQACDAISGSRPGARREVMDSYIKRLKELEDLALSFDGVNKCYAIQAGRELRVIVDSDSVSDQKAGSLSYEISQKIEQDMQYPGQIRITVIRETRAVNYAK